MSKEQITVDSAELEIFIKAAIKETVNGKIDRLADHLEKQDRVIARNQKALKKLIKDSTPPLEAIEFLKKLYKYTKWGGPIILSIIAAVIAIKTFILSFL